MQNKIKNILAKNKNSKKIFSELKNFFQENKIFIFSDLDDTITQNSDIFFSKVKILERRWKNNSENFSKILEKFQINKKFLSILKKNNFKEIFILSRNSQEFVDFFVKQTEKIFSEEWIKILWWIWYSENFKIKTEDKIKAIPKDSFLVSDIFECKKLKSYKNFICIEKFSYFEYNKIILFKIFFLIKFIIKND